MIKRSEEDEEHKDNAAFEKIYAWRSDFLKLGGFNHMLYVLANLNLDHIDCTLELTCIKTVLELIFKLMVSAGKLKQANIIET